MNNVNKTLYIPLYGKAYVSKKGLFLEDRKAEELWEKEGFPLKGKAKSKYLAYYMGIRAAVFDAWLKTAMAETEDAVILHIGCGLDSRVLRVGTQNHVWYDLDFPEVIAQRRLYYTESEKYRMMEADIRTNDWLTLIPERKNAVVLMEGVSMYLTPAELKAFANAVSAHFDRVLLLTDCYTSLAAKLSRYKNPINEVGVSKVYSMDDPRSLENQSLCFVKEHDMTPNPYINELRGLEKAVFETLYAGRLSKKLYRLFEYKTK